MHKSTILLILVIIVASFAFSPSSHVAQAQGFNTYNDGTFLIEYPAAWQPTPYGDFIQHGAVFGPSPVTIPQDDGFPLLFENPSLGQALLSGPLVGVLLLPSASVEGSPRDIMEELMDESEYDVISTERSRPITLGGVSGVEVIGVVAAGDYQFGVHAIAISNNTTFALFVAGVLQSNFETNRSQFEHMAQSLALATTVFVAPPVDMNASDLTPFEGYGYSIGRPAAWQISTVETFDAGLAAFCPSSIQLVNDDLQIIVDALYYFDDKEVNPTLLACLLNGPTAGILTVPIVFTGDPNDDYDDYIGPARGALETLIVRGDSIQSIEIARTIQVGGIESAELQGTVVMPLEYGGGTFGVYMLAVPQGDWLIIFAATGPITQFQENLSLFKNMAYSLTPISLPDYTSNEDLEGTAGGSDRDSDGITDEQDACPDEAGPVSANGCPDADGDGVRDADDACPAVANYQPDGIGDPCNPDDNVASMEAP